MLLSMHTARTRRNCTPSCPSFLVTSASKYLRGSTTDVSLMAACLRGTHAVFLAITANDIPSRHMSQDSAHLPLMYDGAYHSLIHLGLGSSLSSPAL
ncbi:uncharacterized protein BDV17DRAFT_252577 [Aspergillus undulatus]|uniref:uncharacterized protein n=1 Tax=Aspergillus undulatus TaxID=1810928 RepID=UPI003CCDADFE